MNLLFFFVSSLRFSVFCDRFGMNSVDDCIMHKNDIASDLSVGGDTVLRASTFSGSGLTPSLPIIMPQKGMLSFRKKHFFAFKVMPDFNMTFNTLSISSSCSSFDFVARIRSS